MLIQSKNTNKVLELIWPDEGLGALINRMTLLIQYCLENNIYFIFYENISIGNWNDYFETFWDRQEDLKIRNNALEIKIITRDPAHSSEYIKQNILKEINTILNQAIVRDGGQKTEIYFLQHARHKKKEITSPNLTPENTNISQEEIFKKIYRLKKETINKIDGFRQKLNLPQHYACFHFRQGDNITLLGSETKKIEDYLNKLRTLSSTKDIFVCTDNFKVIEALNKTDLSIHYLTTPNQIGHDQKIFNNDQFKDDKVIQMLSEIEIASQSDFFIGRNSAFSNLIKLRHKNPLNCFKI